MQAKDDNLLPRVGILLATHKPNEDIALQIESIKFQEAVSTRIYWGDYGSSEKTKDYVRSLLNGSNYVEISIDRPGPAANFFHLLRHCEEDFIAFSDQDDIWILNKLINQINLIRNFAEVPSLAHSNVEKFIDGRRIQRDSICGDHQFSSLAITNCCQGCTIMINRKAREMILSSLPGNLVWHDWWIGIVVSMTGKIFVGSQTEVLYRIHNGNTIGLPNTFKRLKNFISRDPGLVSYQIREAVERYGHYLNPQSPLLRQLQNLSSDDWKKRLIANIRAKRTRRSILEEIMHRLAWTIRKP